MGETEIKTRMTEEHFQMFRAKLNQISEDAKTKLSAVELPEDMPRFDPTPEQEEMFERVGEKMRATLEQTLRDSVDIVDTDGESDMTVVNGELTRKDRLAP